MQIFLTEEEKNKFAEENIKLVHYVANKFRDTGHQYDDLVGIGMVGFTKALNSYQKDKTAKISTYAIFCIRNEILHFLRRENKHLANNISAEATLYENSEGKTMSLLDILSEEVETESDIIFEETKTELMEEIAKLPEKEQEIIQYRFGLGGRRVLKQREIGNLLGMTQANVSKLESGILEKLAIAMEKRGIRDYLD